MGKNKKDSFGSPYDYVTAGAKHRPSADMLTPDELLYLSQKYFEFMRTCTWEKLEVCKSGFLAGTTFSVPTSTPLDINSFLLFTGLNKKKWNAMCNDSFYADICEQISMCIELQNYEGAAVGIYNANLISRRNGFVDKTESKIETPPEQITGIEIM